MVNSTTGTAPLNAEYLFGGVIEKSDGTALNTEEDRDAVAKHVITVSE